MHRLPTADPYLPGHGDPSYSVRHYDLDLAYALEGNRLSGTATLDVVTLEETARLVLDLAHLRASKVRVDGAGLKKWSARSDRRVVAAADADPAWVSPRDGAPVSKVVLTAPVPLSRVASFHIDDEVTAGMDEEADELLWYDVTELDDVRSFFVG